MMEKRFVVAGNWKMMLSHKGELEVGRSLKKLLSRDMMSHTDVVICPSFVSLFELAELFEGVEGISIGGQNVAWEEKAAMTGMVSINQITPAASWCIVGHSEQRMFTSLTEELVRGTTELLLAHGVSAIVCIGETAKEKQEGRTIERVTEQVVALLENVTVPMLRYLVITYEPIWAISANNPERPPEPNEAAGVMLLIRKLVAERFGDEVAQRLRILYGGSVSPENVGDFMGEPGIDGALVGSASVHPMKFLEIVRVTNDLASSQ